jgi:hypothetical protein
MPIFTHDALNHFIRICVLRIWIWLLAGAVFSHKVVVVTVVFIDIRFFLKINNTFKIF